MGYKFDKLIISGDGKNITFNLKTLNKSTDGNSWYSHFLRANPPFKIIGSNWVNDNKNPTYALVMTIEKDKKSKYNDFIKRFRLYIENINKTYGGAN